MKKVEIELISIDERLPITAIKEGYVEVIVYRSDIINVLYEPESAIFYDGIFYDIFSWANDLSSINILENVKYWSYLPNFPINEY